MRKHTPIYRLMERELGSPPIDYIMQQRELDPPVAFRKIAAALAERTKVDITAEVARRWHNWEAAERTQAASQN